MLAASIIKVKSHHGKVKPWRALVKIADILEIPYPETKQNDDAADTQHCVPESGTSNMLKQFGPGLHKTFRTVAEPKQTFHLGACDYDGWGWSKASDYRNWHKLYQKTCTKTFN